MKYFNRVLILSLLGVIISYTAIAATETATALILSKSFQVLPSQAQFVAGVGNVTSYFSTFNGTAGSFLVDSAHGGVVSGELRPRSTTAGIYEGAYEEATPLSVIDYGSYAVNVPTTDSSGIGITDVLQFDKAGSFSATGSGYDTAAGGATFSITFSFSRAANSAVGTYSATTINTAGQSYAVNGQFNIGGYSGTASYTRGSTNTLTFALTDMADLTRSISGATTYTVTNSDQISYAAFSTHDSLGNINSVLAGTLTRSGNKYLGDLRLVDGLLQTYWADFTAYRVQLTDINNSSGDGIPDFSDPFAVPPAISVQPASQTVTVGSAATLSVTSSGAQTYQWNFNGVAITGATNATLFLGNVSASNAGFYTVTVINPAGSITSGSATLTVSTPSPPAFTVLPLSQTVSIGQNVTFTAMASGSPTYQWSFAHSGIAGAIGSTLTLTNVQLSSAGIYTLTATNPGGGIAVDVMLTVTPAAALPTFTLQPISQTVLKGSTVVFNSDANGYPSPTFSWSKDGTIITSATSKRLVVTGVTGIDAGTYICTAKNSSGSVFGNAATLALASSSNPGRLVNLSIIGEVRGTLAMGFVVGGSGGSGSESLLVRATGPALAAFGVSGFMADPTLTVIQQSNHAMVATNSGWGTPLSNQMQVQAADNATGAFALSNSASLDSALFIPLPISTGGYSVQVAGKSSDSGTVLAEIYDDTFPYTITAPRLVNLSCLNQIGAGGTMSAGFVIGGSTSETVLIRATGPALALAPFNVGGTMVDPQIVVRPLGSGTVLALNAGWGGDPQITVAGNSVGAFQLTNSSSLDSAVLVTLPPGAYTAQVSSAGNSSGTTLTEVYEIPPITTLLSDNFPGSTIDPIKWQTILPLSTSSIIQNSGSLTTTGRGILATARQFSAPYVISGTFTMLHSLEHFNVALRSNLSSTGASSSYERSGVIVTFVNDGQGFSIQNYTSASNWTQLATTPFPFVTGQSYTFVITDTGTAITVSVNGANSLSASTTFQTGNYTAFYSRELSPTATRITGLTISVLSP